MKWFLLKTYSQHQVIPTRDSLRAEHIRCFVHTKFVPSQRDGHPVERPAMFNFVFVCTDDDRLKWFIASHPELKIHLAMTKDREDIYRPLVIPEDQMMTFIRVVNLYDENVPFFKPTADMLAKGDRVRVIAGPLAGHEGILVTQQGQDGGRVIVHVADALAVPTIHIAPEDLQVLQFGKGSHHFYQKVNSFRPRLSEALAARRQKIADSAGEYGYTDPLDPVLADPLRCYIRCFGSLTLRSANTRAEHLALLMQSHLLLAEFEQAANLNTQLSELAPQLNSERYRLLIREAQALYDELTKF